MGKATAPKIALAMDVDGLELLSVKIGGIARRVRNPRPAFNVVADLLEGHVALQFSKEGRRGGKAWKRLRPSTIAARAGRKGYYKRAKSATHNVGSEHPILTWSGQLRRSFKRNHKDHVRNVSKFSLTWGSSYPVAKYLNKKRPILRFKNKFQKREHTYQAVRMWIQGVPIGAIKTVMMARTGTKLF